MPLHPTIIAPERRIYCNRTLNLRAIQAIGYDMDYTLIHYHVHHWEGRAYEHLYTKLQAKGWPLCGLSFDPQLTVRGLVLDLELGNIVKSNRFGLVKRAFHGLRPLDYETQRQAYQRTMVDLAERRYIFVNTLFSQSEVCMYAQLVDLLDRRQLPGVLGYADLYHEVKRALDETHLEGQLKAEIIGDPERFIDLDPETPLALLDQARSGKKLLLITNSEWDYTRAVMAYAFDRFLPDGVTWRELFDVVIVSARKPAFFTDPSPLFEVVDEQGLLKAVTGGLRDGGIYLGGNAGLVEKRLNLPGDQILYVGDHIFSDVHVSKSVLRWRTALILRELEEDILAATSFAEQQEQLRQRMIQKELLELESCQLRLELLRQEAGYGPSGQIKPAQAKGRLAQLRVELQLLDDQIAPLAKAAAEVGNAHWGLALRAGNEKSQLARQVERYADIYTSRVSNFLHQTPFAYLRSAPGRLPHEMGE
jgi:5'-nucleotidase